MELPQHLQGERLGDIEGRIDVALEAAQRPRQANTIRPSEIGHECERFLWMRFHWMFEPERFEGNTLRIFDRGNREEDRIIAHLRASGTTIINKDPETGQQWQMSAANGHMKGFSDGLLYGLPRDPMTVHVIEAKSHNDDSFKALLKKGVVASKPAHYAQTMIYAQRFRTAFAVYAAVNKNNQRYFLWRFPANNAYAETLFKRAVTIRDTTEAPPRLSGAPKHAACHECPAMSVCLGLVKPLVNCRSCRAAQPVAGGKWQCNMHGFEIDADTMKTGCKDHTMIANMTEV